MHRTQLLELLAQYHPTCPREIVAKERMSSFVRDNVACFERSLEIGHVTASAWLLSKDGSHALLTHHAKFDEWLQLGGHCDGDADVLRVAIREAQEESGISGIVAVSPKLFDIDFHDIPAYGAVKEHVHYDVRFLLQVVSDESFVVSHESKALQWVMADVDALPTQNFSIRRMVEKWKRRVV